MKFRVLIFLSLILLAALPSSAFEKKVSLVGLEKICVVVESLDPVYKGDENANRKKITLAVRSKLAKAGLKISSKREYKDSAYKIPVLSISYETLNKGGEILTSAINIRMIDVARLERQPGKTVTVTSWSASMIASVSKKRKFKLVDHTLSLVNRFISDWKLSNRNSGE